MGRVFISHSYIDRSFAEKIANDLSRRGLNVWYSEWQMKPGDSLTQKVSEGIISSGSMLVLLSKSSVQSKWVEKELSLALCNSLASKNVQIVPVLIETCTFPRSFHFLGDTIYADFRDNYDTALNRLLAALGVRPSRRGIKLYEDDPSSLNVEMPGEITISCWEGLEMLWEFDRLAESIDLRLTKDGAESEWPLLQIPLTKKQSSKVQGMRQNGGWGYYDLIDPVGPYRALINVAFLTSECEPLTFRWLIDGRRRRAIRVSWDIFVGEDDPTFGPPYD
ncbi:MAG: toll/interleukin-1 receptor domain-containing protein [Streptosporangiaceae bacterium]